MTLPDATKAFTSLAPREKLRFLALFGHNLTVTARDTYEVQSPGVESPQRLRAINEIQHQLLAHVGALLNDSELRYSDDALLEILLEHDDAHLSQQASWAFEHALKSVPRISGSTHRFMDIVLQTNTTDPELVLRDCHRLDARTFECKLYVRSSGFVAERQFWFEKSEFSEFRRQLAEMHKSLKGAAELRTRYEENGFRLEVHGNGTVTVSGTLREYGATDQLLRFAFATDQTVLARFVHDLTQLSLLQPPTGSS